MRTIFLALPLLLAAHSVAAQPAPQRHISPEVLFLTHPQAAPPAGSFAPQSVDHGAPGERDTGEPGDEETYRIFISGDAGRMAARVVDAGGRVLSTRGTTVHAEVTRFQLGILATDPDVEGLEISRPVHPYLNESRAAVGVPPIEAGEGLDQPYTGKGVLVGIVDTGIDIRHPAFRHANGNTRILSVWDQTIEFTDGSRRPAGFNTGIECTADLINQQLTDKGSNACPTDDSQAIQGVPTFGHGTHVAGIVAGNDETYRGMAPEATIIAVRALFEEGFILDAVDYILDKADETGRPVVVNLSLGTSDGAHDGTARIEREMSERAGPGQIIVAAAGNEAIPDDIGIYTHAGITLPDDPDAIHLGPIVVPESRQVGADSFSIELTLWAQDDVNRPIYVAALRRGESEGTVTVQNPTVTWQTPGTAADIASATSTVAVRGPNDVLRGYVHMLAGVSPWNGRNETRIYIDRCPENPCTFGGTPDPDVEDFSSTFWSLNFQGEEAEGTLNLWPVAVSALFLESRSLGVQNGLDYPWDESPVFFHGGDNRSTITIPATARDVIAVGSQVQRDRWTDLQGRTQPPAQMRGEAPGALSDFSSQGPATDGRVKPDVVAPGEWIVSAYSLRDESLPAAFEVAEDYVVQRGTSMAAPHVAGIIALMLQRNPELRSGDIIGPGGLMTRNTQTTNETGELPNEQWGFGIVDAQAIFTDPDFAFVADTDMTPPELRDISVDTSGLRATATWRTNEPANSEIILRDKNGEEFTGISLSYTTRHSISVRGDSGSYSVYVRSTDLAGNTSETRVERVSLGGCGCGSAEGPSGADAVFMVVMFGIAAVFLRRRTAPQDKDA